MLGNTYYAVCQWFVLVIIARLEGPEAVGQFTLALALTAPVVMFFATGMRTLLASDVEQDHGFTAYLTTKIIMAVTGLLICTGIALWYGGTLFWIILAVALSKTVESVSDMYYGYAQQQERLNRISISLISRGTLSTALLTIVYIATDSLTFALYAYLASWLLALLLYDRKNTLERYHKLTVDDVQEIKKILMHGAPLGLTMLILMLSPNIPRYFLEHHNGMSDLGIFSSMAYFIIVGNIPVMALGQSLVPVLAKANAAGETRRFRSLVARALLGVAGLGLCGIGAAYFIGEFVLNLVYGPEFAAKADILPLIAIAAAIGYLGNILGYAISAAKIFKAQAPGFAIVALVSLAASLLLIPSLGLYGAAYVLILNSIASVLVPLALLVWHQLKSHQKTVG